MSELSPERTTVGVLGSGSWGTALAIHCARMGHDTVLWTRGSATAAAINGPARQNTAHLPGYPCPPGMRASTDLAEVVGRSELLLVVVPTQYIEQTLGSALRSLLRPHQLLVSCSKGLQLGSLETVDELMERLVAGGGEGQEEGQEEGGQEGGLCDRRRQLAFLSGPSFAAEVAAGQPTAVTVAAKDERVAARVQALLSTPRFRCYRSTDVAGVELGGALKNVLAIACGISDGLGFGNNGRAALITRGLYEITKLAVARGAHPLTMSGLAGMGDLVLTCTGDLSRNRTVGLRLGRGEALADIQASMGGAVAEGVPTAVAIHTLARRLGVDCPVMEGIHRVIHEGADAQEVVAEVMSRALKPEVAPDMIRDVLAGGRAASWGAAEGGGGLQGGGGSKRNSMVLELPASPLPSVQQQQQQLEAASGCCGNGNGNGNGTCGKGDSNGKAGRCCGESTSPSCAAAAAAAAAATSPPPP
ncbi:hypothetical protein Agub_g8245, partial [Astrephomene gubernaculifera]